MKHKHILITLAVLLPLGVGAFVIYKYFKGSRSVPMAPTGVPATGGTGSGSFPLKKGSKNPYVGQLQAALNKAFNTGLVVDSNWGPLTDQAVSNFLSMSSITNLSTFNTVIASLNATSKVPAGAAF